LLVIAKSSTVEPWTMTICFGNENGPSQYLHNAMDHRAAKEKL